MRELLESRISNTLLTVKLLLAKPEVPAAGISGFGFGLGAGLTWEDEVNGLFGLFAGFDSDGCAGRSFWVEGFPDDGVIGFGFGLEAGFDWKEVAAGLFGLFAGRAVVGRVGRSFWPVPALLWHDPIGYQANFQ